MKIVNFIYDYYEQLGKSMTIPLYKESDQDVLCIMDIYESSETADGLSQTWFLKVQSEKSILWQTFIENCYSIKCTGGIPGAKEAAQKMLSL